MSFLVMNTFGITTGPVYFEVVYHKKFSHISGGSKGVTRTALPLNSISFISMQFLAKMQPNNKLVPHPLENPGSATALLFKN